MGKYVVLSFWKLFLNGEKRTVIYASFWVQLCSKMMDFFCVDLAKVWCEGEDGTRRENAERRRAHNGNREEMEYMDEGCVIDSAERIAEKMDEGKGVLFSDASFAAHDLLLIFSLIFSFLFFFSPFFPLFVLLSPLRLTTIFFSCDSPSFPSFLFALFLCRSAFLPPHLSYPPLFFSHPLSFPSASPL